MNEQEIKERLAHLPLGEIRYRPRVTSTNQMAREFAADGAPDFSLVVADEQTAGRGRQGRSWITVPGAGLAVSVLLPSESRQQPERLTGRLSGLGALAGVQALETACDLSAEIKWPNDLLLRGKKVGGVLVELAWRGDVLQEVILGVGINVRRHALPEGVRLRYPATTIEEQTGRPGNRVELLVKFLESLLFWYPRREEERFHQAWQDSLAFRGERVQVTSSGQLLGEGRLLGLTAEGTLRIRGRAGRENIFEFGEITLRPVDRS